MENNSDLPPEIPNECRGIIYPRTHNFWGLSYERWYERTDDGEWMLDGDKKRICFWPNDFKLTNLNLEGIFKK